MAKVKKEEIKHFIESNIQTFHSARLGNLLHLKLLDVLKKKNPLILAPSGVMW